MLLQKARSREDKTYVTHRYCAGSCAEWAANEKWPDWEQVLLLYDQLDLKQEREEEWTINKHTEVR